MSERALISADVIRQIAEDEGIDVRGTLSGIEVCGTPLTREQIIEMLRLMDSIPDDRGGHE